MARPLAIAVTALFAWSAAGALQAGDAEGNNAVTDGGGCPNETTASRRLWCEGARLVGRAADALLSQKRLRLSDDVEMVEVGERAGRGLPPGAVDGGKGSPWADAGRKLGSLLSSRELRLRMPSLSWMQALLGNETLNDALDALHRAGYTRQVMMASAGTGRGKNKGGGALAAAMLMSAATVGAVGLKGIGLLALKALALSSAAFVLSLVAALKKLVSKDDEGGGGGHYVQYVPLHHSSGHHRRSLDTTPYRAHR